MSETPSNNNLIMKILQSRIFGFFVFILIIWFSILYVFLNLYNDSNLFKIFFLSLIGLFFFIICILWIELSDLNKLHKIFKFFNPDLNETDSIKNNKDIIDYLEKICKLLKDKKESDEDQLDSIKNKEDMIDCLEKICKFLKDKEESGKNQFDLKNILGLSKKRTESLVEELRRNLITKIICNDTHQYKKIEYIYSLIELQKIFDIFGDNISEYLRIVGDQVHKSFIFTFVMSFYSFVLFVLFFLSYFILDPCKCDNLLYVQIFSIVCGFIFQIFTGIGLYLFNKTQRDRKKSEEKSLAMVSILLSIIEADTLQYNQREKYIERILEDLRVKYIQ